jgi:cbb3-type cytochrome oxidase subunit 1
MGERFIKVAVVYFVIGVLFGLYMGIAHNFLFTSVHAHINLLGWVSMALFGLIYLKYPNAGETRLAKTHFWLHNLGLPVMQGTIFIMLLTENESIVFGAIIGSLGVVIGTLLFAFNLFKNLKA